MTVEARRATCPNRGWKAHTKSSRSTPTDRCCSDERERLSDLLRVTEGTVFRDHEFAEHLARVAAAEDDLPEDRSR